MVLPGIPTTVRDAIGAVDAVIRDAGVGDTPRLDAELLVGAVAGLDRVGLRVHGDEARLEPQQWQRLDELVGRRAGGEPIAYLLGTAWFHGLEFEVDERVLVPRPETEQLVDLGVAHARALDRPARVVDACTGSGCVAVAIAVELGTGGQVLATDLSADALEVARANGQRHGVDVAWHEGDLLEPLAGSAPVDVVVANPPYVEVGDPGLEANVRDHEPHVALFLPQGSDVTAFYARLAAQAADLLGPGGLLVVEHGQGQRQLVVDAFVAAGLAGIEGRDDLAGIDRIVLGRKP